MLHAVHVHTVQSTLSKQPALLRETTPLNRHNLWTFHHAVRWKETKIGFMN